VLIQGIVEGLTSEDGLASILEAIPTLIGALIEGILGNLDKIISAGITLCIQLGVGLVRAIPQLVAMLPRIIQAIWNALKNVDWVGLGRSLLETIGTGILNGASAIYNAVRNAIQGAINFLKNLGMQAFQWGKDMLVGFGRGIMNAANALWEKVKAIAEKIRGFLHFSRPDFGPLRDYEQWMPDFMQGLARGIDANAWRVEDAMKGVASDMTLKGGSVTNVGGVSVVINTTPNQDANAIAQQVIAVMTNELNAKRAVFA
jgi:phage-related protein